MKRVLVGIFAHPDDEAFGPSGTLLKLIDDGYDVHLIVLTDGEAGTNPDDTPNLASVRLEEWQRAGQTLGASSLTALHFPDGGLEQTNHDELIDGVRRAVESVLTDYDEPPEVSFMTFEPTGLTGHRDHVTTSTIALETFEALNSQKGHLWYYCLDKHQAPLEDTPYYHPQARTDDYITDRIDVSPYLRQKYSIIDCHDSQRTDGSNVKALGDELLSTECFRIVS